LVDGVGRNKEENSAMKFCLEKIFLQNIILRKKIFAVIFLNIKKLYMVQTGHHMVSLFIFSV